MRMMRQLSAPEQKKKDLESLVKEKMKELGSKYRFPKRLPKRPIPEVYCDWLTVKGFADKVRLDILNETLENKRRRSRYATCQAYLDLARLEKNPGQAWNFVNSADKLLPLLVKPKDFRKCQTRQENWDDKLGRLDKDAKRELAILKSNPPENWESSKVVTGEMIDYAYRLQAGRAQLWYAVANGILSLKYTMFRWYTNILAVTVSLAVLTAEILFQYSVSDNPLWYRPFVTVSIMGIFGGGLSVRLRAGSYVKQTISIQLIRVMIETRILIGAAGALTVYILLESGILFSGIWETAPDKIFALLGLGIIAGFSEQLFVKSLKESAENVSIFGKPNLEEEPKDESEEADASEGSQEPR